MYKCNPTYLNNLRTTRLIYLAQFMLYFVTFITQLAVVYGVARGIKIPNFEEKNSINIDEV